MAVQLSPDLCIGAAQCTRNAPEVFTQDEDGLVRLLPGASPDPHDPAVREAALACPVQAIRLPR